MRNQENYIKKKMYSIYILEKKKIMLQFGSLACNAWDHLVYTSEEFKPQGRQGGVGRGVIKTKMPKSYLNKRNTVPYACRNGAYPDPERNTTTIKQKSLVIKHENTLPKLISSRHHPCVRDKNIYVSQKDILFNCFQHLYRNQKLCT